MRTALIVLALCYVVDAMAFDGRYLETSASIIKMESFSISSGFQRWFKQTFF